MLSFSTGCHRWVFAAIKSVAKNGNGPPRWAILTLLFLGGGSRQQVPERTNQLYTLSDALSFGGSILAMALSQQQLTAVAASLSSARLGTYINASGFGANATPLDIYVWNALISGAFYTSLHICEVVMRNAISHALELKYGVNWPWSQGLERTLSKWSKEELQSARQGIPAGSTGKVIAELKFAFWCRLLTSGQDQHLWNANIRIVFPNLPFPMTVAAGRTMLYNDMEALRVFRNRIAHHEPIIGYPLVQYQARIQRLLKLRCAVIDQWMSHWEIVTAALAKRP